MPPTPGGGDGRARGDEVVHRHVHPRGDVFVETDDERDDITRGGDAGDTAPARVVHRRVRDARAVGDARDGGGARQGRDALPAVAAKIGNAKSLSWGSKFPAFSKALRDDRLPWGRLIGSVEKVQRSFGSSTSLDASLGAGGSASNGQTWAGAVYNELAPLKIANSYESRLLPSWKLSLIHI